MDTKEYKQIDARTGEFIFCFIFFLKITALIAFIISKKAERTYQRAMTSETIDEKDSLYNRAVRLDNIAGGVFTFNVVFSFIMLILSAVLYGLFALI